jgi:hypothetical protein
MVVRYLFGNHQLFGGISIIATGDFYQLKPVFDGWIFDDRNSLCNAWKQALTTTDLPTPAPPSKKA